MQHDGIERIKFNFDYVRPKGTKLKTFGGTASGHEPLKDMFEKIDMVLKGMLDPDLEPPEIDDYGFVKLRPIHILDIGNLIGHNVVVGGVRRTSEIFLFDAHDYESLFAKYGINGFWKEEDFERHERIRDMLIGLGIEVPKFFDRIGERNFDEEVNGDKPYNFGRPLHHRRMSNNSVVFIDKPDREFFGLVSEILQLEGEPGFVNMYEAARRRLIGLGIENPSDEMIREEAKRTGLNPCAEILLDSKGVCNLTTVNVMAFVKDGRIDLDGLIDAQRKSARAGLRMTLVDLELDAWDAVQKRDRLIGTSLTGWQDALGTVDKDETGMYKVKSDKIDEAYPYLARREILEILNETVRNEAESYARELRVTVPRLTTTVKPEGTLSIVANGVSNGVHFSHAPYYIRRIRISAADPLAKTVQSLGFTVHAEVGTAGYTVEEDLARPDVIEQAETLVIDFPVKSGTQQTKDDVSALEQLDVYFEFQRHYTEHNASNTISVKPHEWEAVEQRIYDDWDSFTAVSFLAHDGGSYRLAPNEAISKSQYEKLVQEQPTFEPSMLEVFETGEDFDIDMTDCINGSCPVR